MKADIRERRPDGMNNDGDRGISGCFGLSFCGYMISSENDAGDG